MEKKPIVVVTGFMRSGTSMMMKSLIAGGLTALYDKERDKYRKQFADEYYDPNEGGLYEITPELRRRSDFEECIQGRLIKTLRMGLCFLPPDNDYRIIFMRRDHEECRQSCIGFFGDSSGYNVEKIDELIHTMQKWIKVRRDFRSIDVWYPDVISDPRKEFTRIKDSLDIDINVDIACKIVKPELYRYRRNELIEGIM